MPAEMELELLDEAIRLNTRDNDNAVPYGLTAEQWDRESRARVDQILQIRRRFVALEIEERKAREAQRNDEPSR